MTVWIISLSILWKSVEVLQSALVEFAYAHIVVSLRQYILDLNSVTDLATFLYLDS